MRVVLAIGGNVILKPESKVCFETYAKTITDICKEVSKLVENTFVVAITHGNGPQVGNILRQQEKSQG